jgi:hypothetical protein
MDEALTGTNGGERPMKKGKHPLVVLVCFLVVAVSDCSSRDEEAHPTPSPEPPQGNCDDFSPHRNPYFGDLHVHTTYSYDAANFGTRTDPFDAYDFARGMEIGLAPYDENGNPARTVQLRRPLDFAAVTDHSEFFAETSICTDPSSSAYDSLTCSVYRGSGGNGIDLLSFLVFTLYIVDPTPVPSLLCKALPEECADRYQKAWQTMRDAAEAAYDRSSACSFTSFVGYEYSGTSLLASLHRNVIFRGARVADPVSYIDAPTPGQLWQMLDATCTHAGNGCELLTIPHNTNMGGGGYFTPLSETGDPYTAAEAARRARMEPLMEIYQNKGASECIGGEDPLSSEEELCGFELMTPQVCTGSPDDAPNCSPLCSNMPGGTNFGAYLGRCVQPSDFARGALRKGLAEQSRTGTNPFKMGFIGSADTHNSTAGYVTEDNYEGSSGFSDDQLAEQLGGLTGEGLGKILTEWLLPNPDFGKFYSPGGLAVVWAEENTRDSLFDAMKRRETYATSGSRIIVRFFGGWDYPENLCEHTDLIDRGYAEGVPMGGDLLPSPTGGEAPKFLVSALRDTGTPGLPGTQLQRIQIIKGWIEEDGTGETHERVHEVAGDPSNGASVDLATCETQGSGFDSLCAVWTDPDFDPNEAAFYYARVVENPTCRWSQRQCNAAGVDCATMDPEDPLANCCNGSIPPSVQERAWTSPIWYTPQTAAMTSRKDS